RLSYFLWASMPDEELFALADGNRLRDPAVLSKQIRRMLLDNRAKSLVTEFAGQWLELRNLDRVAPDPSIYPQFDEKLRIAMRREVELFIENIIREDRNVLEMIDSDYTYLNER